MKKLGLQLEDLALDSFTTTAPKREGELARGSGVAETLGHP